MLTEHEIARTWRTLFHCKTLDEEVLAKADALLEELRPESPLRHRLGAELDEIRDMKVRQSCSR